MTDNFAAFDLTKYLSDGIERQIQDVLKATLKNPKETAFLLSFARQAKKAAKHRSRFEQNGEHIPPFLIMSITQDCNLRCAGCYAMAGAKQNCGISLPADEWARLFREAADLGVSMILLAGGEPFLRRDVLECAANQTQVLFPVFTNGTLWNTEYEALFEQRRNLVPIVSLEGDMALTDNRRGDGVHNKAWETMRALEQAGLLFGVSVTVTRENLSVVTGDAFQSDLRAVGCKVVFYVEYVPIENEMLALDNTGRATLNAAIERLRGESGILYISFPGDEAATGGCLAAGRGFFHINAGGFAEPCPFAPYSDTDMRGRPLREALKSPLFRKLRESEVLNEPHSGGCVLFENQKWFADYGVR